MESIMSRFLYSLVIFLAVFCVKSSAIPQPEVRAETPFSFEDIFDTSLRPKGFSPTWISGENAFYYRNSTTGHVVKRDALTQEETILVNGSYFERENRRTGTYYMSHDLSHVLFAYDIEYQWRHSFSARYEVLHRDTNILRDFPVGPLAGQKLNYARWAPSSNVLSFVYNNDLYYQRTPMSLEPPERITNDGHPTDIFNGVPDWLYEEDVLGERVTHYWSPDSKYICYAKINVTDVPFISWPLYGDKSDVYGKTREIRYPKAGDVRDGVAGPNSVATLFVVDVSDSTNPPIQILPPDELADQDHYYVQVVWANATSLYVTWTNRVQTYSHGVFYDVSRSPILAERGQVYREEGGWIDVAPPMPTFIDSRTFITIHPEPRGETGKWRQLVVYNNEGVGSTRRVSADKEEEVDYIYGYNSTTNMVYYSATNGDPTERHIFKVSLDEGSVPVCLTCNFPASCRYITSSFSDSGEFYFVNCRGPEVPTYSLRSTLPEHSTLDVIMENNTDVRQLLSQKALPTREFRDIPIGGGYMGKAEIFIPPGHVEGKTYPLLIYAYAGPGSQRVMKTFPMGSNTANWLTYLKSTHKVVVVSVDSRGASGRGDKFKFEMYKNLGTVEVQDQIAAGRHFGNDPLVNKDKIKGVFGWSYGGGTAAHVIGDPSSVITCGISVAPVTTKMYYDTAYTERYLGLATPDDDAEGYNKTDVMNKAANFKNKKFMLNHGIADDNVHYMHTTQLIQALANAGVRFRQNAYIDQNHGISSPGPARHLYDAMTQFLLDDCWNGSTESETVSHSVVIRHDAYVTGILGIFSVLLNLFLRT